MKINCILHAINGANELNSDYIWRPPSLGELTLMIFNMGLTHLGSEASIYILQQKMV